MDCQKDLDRASDVDIARSQYNDLLARELRGSSDMEPAMRRLEAKYGLPYWQQWSARYQHSRRVSHRFMDRVKAAWLMHLKQTVRRDIARLKSEHAAHADADISDLVIEAETLLAKIETKMRKAA